MKLQQMFEEWAQLTAGRYADKQWLLAKWEVNEGVLWPKEKVDLMIRTITEGLQLQPGNSLVDLGCGGAWILNQLAPRVRTACGLDFSQVMLENAVTSFPELSFVQGLIGRLPFRDQSIDRLLCYFVLINMEDDRDVENAIMDMYRVLCHGGRILIGQLPDKNGSASYELEKNAYAAYCERNFSVGKSLRDQIRMPQKLFDIPQLERFLRSMKLQYEFRPAFNPFYHHGAAQTVSWRFDLVITR